MIGIIGAILIVKWSLRESGWVAVGEAWFCCVLVQMYEEGERK